MSLRPPTSSPIPWLAALILAGLAACGGSGDLERARTHLANHRLEAAEALLEGRSGEAPQRLLDEVRRAQEERAARLADIESIAGTQALDEARSALREVARRDPDPQVREHAGRILAGLVNRIAEERVAGLSYSNSKRRAGEGPGALPSLPPPEPTALPPVPAPSGPDGTEVALRQPQGAAGEALPLAQGTPVREGGAGSRLSGPASAGISQPSAEAASPSAGAPTSELALELERQGRLAEARSAWIDLTFQAPPGPQRTALVARARALERRLVLRVELAAAVSGAPERFAPEGISGGDERFLVVEGEPCDWARVDEPLLRRLAARANLSREARLGLVLEGLARGGTAGRAAALAELDRLLQRGDLEESEVFAVLADHRGEELPEGGYVFVQGAWITRAAHEEALLVARVRELGGLLARAQGAARDQALTDLVALGEVARPALIQGLEERGARAAQILVRGNTLTALARLAERRRELDQRREEALALIFDEETYFYPYNGPDLPPGKKAGDYWPVQRRVDELVARVQEVWGEGLAVRLPAAFGEGLADLAWIQGVARDQDLPLGAPGGLPEWIWGLPSLPQVELPSFAWSAAERELLAYDRAVLALNQRRWAAWSRRSEERAPREEERRQVTITNDYRSMMGRRVLAWNPEVQLAARWHSQYMADTGDFGHTQADPEKRTPFDRMRLAGYDHGVSENCHRGSGSAEGAHLGWRGSSGHHRNILMPSHREMASAHVSGYWTQNFGVGKGFLDELDGWQD